jgi:hypothetical protein
MQLPALPPSHSGLASAPVHLRGQATNLHRELMVRLAQHHARQLVMVDGHCFITAALSLRASRNSPIHCASTPAPAERRSAKISDHNGVLHRDSPACPNAFDTLLRRALPCPLNARTPASKCHVATARLHFVSLYTLIICFRGVDRHSSRARRTAPLRSTCTLFFLLSSPSSNKSLSAPGCHHAD